MTVWPMTLDGRIFTVRRGESVLDACRRGAVPLAFSCCAGVCQTCMLKVQQGAVPPGAQKGLAPELRERGYVLACQCVPQGPMALARPDPLDRQVDAMLLGAETSGPFVYVRLETVRELACAPGDRLLLRPHAEAGELELQVTQAQPGDCAIEALCDGAQPAVDALLACAFGAIVRVRGPLDAAGCEELAQPAPDPQLWAELGEGGVVGEVLNAFYRRVYADALLAGFFTRVTMERSIEKQFSFLKQLMTGERCYFGDRPRNAHHWMVVTPELFAHRQALMREQLQAHGLTESQIARWTRLEAHYRPDIVKSAPWPRRVDGEDLPLDGYAAETLGEGTLCDHCARPLAAGTEVRYHLRLGTVSCEECAPR